MFYTLLFIHILLCVVLIGLVLMQQGKGADMGAAFGGNSSSLFGAGGATDFVTKLTTTLAIAFMVTSILLLRSYISYSHNGGFGATSDPLAGSMIKQDAPPQQAPAEAVQAPSVPEEKVSEPVQKTDASAAQVPVVQDAGAVKEEAKIPEVKVEDKKTASAKGKSKK